jgi:hypothetical protein
MEMMGPGEEEGEFLERGGGEEFGAGAGEGGFGEG